MKSWLFHDDKGLGLSSWELVTEMLLSFLYF